MIEPVRRWRAFERVAHDLGLGWGIGRAQAWFRYARPAAHPFGARFGHLLPAAYREFVAEVGYPMVGYGYHDRGGISFLPPEAMARYSVEILGEDGDWPAPVAGEPTACRHAFFAGTDLAELDGYAFAPSPADARPVVWLVESGMAREPLAPFEEWLAEEADRLEQHTIGYEAHPVEPGAADPHRVFSYSLPDPEGGEYEAADLRLAWVSEAGRRFGLVQSGEWLIGMTDRFREVRPFRGGVAEVRLQTGRWTRITPDGRQLTDDLSPH